MSNYFEIKNNAEQARKQKKWNEALDFYKRIYLMEEANEWDKYFYALILEKIGFEQKSIAVCRKIYSKNKNFNPNNSLYARNIFKITFQKKISNDFKETVKALEALKKLIPEDDNFISFEMMYYKFIKIYEKENKFNFLIQIFEKFYPTSNDYNKLNDKEYLKTLKYPSFAETFLVAQIKAYFSNKNYQTVVDKTNEALKIIKRFNYNNHIWIKRLKAQSLNFLNKKNEALKEYFNIIKYKQDWFLYFELAKILFEYNNKKAAEYFIHKALLDKQDANFKRNLYNFIANNFSEAKCYKYAKEIFELQKSQNNNNQILAINKSATKCATDFFNEKKKTASVVKIFSEKTGLVKLDDKIVFYIAKEKNMDLKLTEKVLVLETWNFDNKKNEVKNSVEIIKKLTL